MAFEIFLAGQPGLEAVLAAEAKSLGFGPLRILPGGVAFDGEWEDVWRANIACRGVGRVLARIGSFPVFHLAQLDKRASKFDWASVFPQGMPVRVDVTCAKSKIYHAGAAAQRIEKAVGQVAVIDKTAPMRLLARIEDNLCTFSIDTSGAALHQRGHKEFVGKAPMRETLAALFLRDCGYTGRETLVDPMCGSGTFVLEAAEMAAGLVPGRDRDFAFEALASCDAPRVAEMRAERGPVSDVKLFGFDRDQGAIKGATANAERAGVSQTCSFAHGAISELQPPDAPPGLVIVNPPYGARIGNRKLLFGLYAALGQVMAERFKGWRFGMVTSDGGLAKATGLKLKSGPPVSFGGLKVRLYQARM